MQPFQELVSIVDRLLGPQGCPWDLEQTMKSVRSDILEEASELVEAIDLEDNEHIKEELGDLFFIVVFLSKLAEKEKRCQMNEALNEINEKLIRRHPHVFGEVIIDNSDQVVKQWGEIKKKEKGKEYRQSALDGIPKELPALARAKKMIKKIKATEFKDYPKKPTTFTNEEELGYLLFNIAQEAQEKGLDGEHALRSTLSKLEKTYRKFESEKGS